MVRMVRAIIKTKLKLLFRYRKEQLTKLKSMSETIGKEVHYIAPSMFGVCKGKMTSRGALCSRFPVQSLYGDGFERAAEEVEKLFRGYWFVKQIITQKAMLEATYDQNKDMAKDDRIFSQMLIIHRAVADGNYELCLRLIPKAQEDIEEFMGDFDPKDEKWETKSFEATNVETLNSADASFEPVMKKYSSTHSHIGMTDQTYREICDKMLEYRTRLGHIQEEISEWIMNGMTPACIHCIRNIIQQHIYFIFSMKIEYQLKNDKNLKKLRDILTTKDEPLIEMEYMMSCARIIQRFINQVKSLNEVNEKIIKDIAEILPGSTQFSFHSGFLGNTPHVVANNLVVRNPSLEPFTMPKRVIMNAAEKNENGLVVGKLTKRLNDLGKMEAHEQVMDGRSELREMWRIWNKDFDMTRSHPGVDMTGF